MKRILYILLLTLLNVSLAMAQSFKVRECTEDEIPSSKRADYYKEAHRIIENHYMLLLESVGDVENREVIIEQMISDKRASTLKTEFLLTQDNNLSFCSPQQYFTRFEYIYKDLVDKVNFKVDNFRDGKIMMNSLISCFIPIEYDLTLMNGDQVLFKRRCQMHCLFPRATASKLVKVMQVKPVKDLIGCSAPDDGITIEAEDKGSKNKISAYLSYRWTEFFTGLKKNRWAIGLFFIFCIIYLTISAMIEEKGYKGWGDITRRFLKLCAFHSLIGLGVVLPLALSVFFCGERGFELYGALVFAAYGVYLIKFRTGRSNWLNWLFYLLAFGGSILLLIYAFTDWFDFML